MEILNPNLPPVELPKKRYKHKKKQIPKKKDKRLKRKFDETNLGSSIKLHAPLEYEMIVSAGGYEPPAELIEAISYASLNPYFRGVYFRRNLIAYRRNGGCYQSYPVKPKPVPKRIAQLRKHLSMLR